MRHVAPWVGLALALVGCGAGARGVDAPPPLGEVELEEVGGEVWSFERRVGGRAPDGCVMVEIKRGALHLRAPTRRGRFSTVVPLTPGENALSVTCVDPPEDARDAQVLYHVRLAPTPRAVVGLTVVDGVVVVDAGGSAPNASTQAPLERLRWSADAANPAPLTTPDGQPLGRSSATRVELSPPDVDGRYVVRLRVVDEAGREDHAGAAFVVERGQARRVDPLDEPPPWLREAVVYGVVPFLFGEPAFEAVTERLARLASLGVSTLWVSPIFEAPADDYGYAVTDYFDVREAWGTLESFRALVDAAHALGLRVMLDFVPSHTSSEHPYFRHAERHGRRSPHRGYYERDAEGRAVHYFDWENLPNLDYSNPEVRRFITEAFSFWLRELDVDGFRVDVAWAIERRAPGFFAELRRELVRIEPDVALVAEASAREPAFHGAGFDAAYDWTDTVGQWAWADVFVEGRADVRALDRALTALPAGSGRVFRFLDNNDTGPRFVTRHGGGLERVAAALLFTVPGVPVLFTGQELGAEYHPYEREEPLELEPDPAREAYYRALATLRRSEPALTAGRFVPLPAEPADRVYAFARVPEEGRPVVAALNFGSTPVTARVGLTDELETLLQQAPAARLFGAARSRARGGALHLALPPHDAVVWGLGPAASAPGRVRVLARRETHP